MATKRRKRFLLFIALGMTGISLLTGCENLSVPMGAQFSDGAVVVAPCTVATATSMRVSTHVRGADSDFIVFEAAGLSLDLSEDQPLEINEELVTHLGGTYSEPEWEADWSLEVGFLLSGGGTWSAVFEVPPEGLPTSGWLHPSGNVTPEPCE